MEQCETFCSQSAHKMTMEMLLYILNQSRYQAVKFLFSALSEDLYQLSVTQNVGGCLRITLCLLHYLYLFPTFHVGHKILGRI